VAPPRPLVSRPHHCGVPIRFVTQPRVTVESDDPFRRVQFRFERFVARCGRRREPTFRAVRTTFGQGFRHGWKLVLAPRRRSRPRPCQLRRRQASATGTRRRGVGYGGDVLRNPLDSSPQNLRIRLSDLPCAYHLCNGQAFSAPHSASALSLQAEGGPPPADSETDQAQGPRGTGPARHRIETHARGPPAKAEG
jgi:hypothetical protein